jgi:hypothetical protein
LDLTSASRAAERADSVRSIEAIVTDPTSVTIAAFGDRRRSHRRLKGGVPDLVVIEARYVFPLSEWIDTIDRFGRYEHVSASARRDVKRERHSMFGNRWYNDGRGSPRPRGSILAARLFMIALAITVSGLEGCKSNCSSCGLNRPRLFRGRNVTTVEPALTEPGLPLSGSSTVVPAPAPGSTSSSQVGSEPAGETMDVKPLNENGSPPPADNGKGDSSSKGTSMRSNSTGNRAGYETARSPVNSVTRPRENIARLLIPGDSPKTAPSPRRGIAPADPVARRARADNNPARIAAKDADNNPEAFASSPKKHAKIADNPLDHLPPLDLADDATDRAASADSVRTQVDGYISGSRRPGVNPKSSAESPATADAKNPSASLADKTAGVDRSTRAEQSFDVNNLNVKEGGDSTRSGSADPRKTESPVEAARGDGSRSSVANASESNSTASSNSTAKKPAAGAGVVLIPPQNPLAEPHKSMIPHFSTVQPRLAGGGAPTKEGLDWLAEKGYQTLLDLREPAEVGPDFIAEVAKRKMRYVALPISLSNLDISQIERYQNELNDAAARPLYFFDVDGSRAGFLWFIRRVEQDQDRADLAGARREAEEMGLTDPKLWVVAETLLGRMRNLKNGPAESASAETSKAEIEREKTAQAASTVEPIVENESAKLLGTRSVMNWKPYLAMLISILGIPLAFWSRTRFSLRRIVRAALPGSSRRPPALPAGTGDRSR